jgi:cardiolipin synthase
MGDIGDRLTPHELVDGNAVDALFNGENAYPAMLDAIDSARRSVYLATYIFDTDETGDRFIDALGRARERGVDVRVIIDGIGQYYSWPPATRELRRAGVPTELFLPPRLLPPRLSINLRLHRKGLVVDGCTAFVGGLNIGDRHLVEIGDDAVADVHFRLDGPIATQLEREFLRTWEFISGERDSPPSVSALPAGDVCCRTVTDGPDEDLDQITMLLNATIAQARNTVRVMTPYFLPPRELIAALQAANLRGVSVKLVLPAKNNLPYVHWATRNILGELLYQGIEVRYQPPPFAHSKLFIVDDCYTLVGSSNWDSRSLRLNFELQVEIFDEELARNMAAHVDDAARRGRRITLEEVDNRSLPERLRDSFFWLFSPYL